MARNYKKKKKKRKPGRKKQVKPILSERRLKIDSGVVGKFHLAGLIPVANLETDWQFPWPEVLAPVGQNITAIESAILQCAWAGCETIWIVANYDLQPILRYYLGSMICDPYEKEIKRNTASFSEHAVQNPKFWKWIPIYYITLDPKIRGKYDSYGYGIVDAIKTIEMSHKKTSEHLKPDKYFVSFPMTVSDPYAPRYHRQEISKKHAFYFSHRGKTILDGEPLPFTLTGETAKEIRINVNHAYARKCLYENRENNNGESWREQPALFSLEEALNHKMPKESQIENLDWAFDIRTQTGYAAYLAAQGLGVDPRTSSLQYANEVVPIRYLEDIDIEIHREVQQ